MLLAATMSSTDSASVFNILRSQKIGLKHHLRPMLELESGSNDPMAYLLTILLIQCLGTDGSVDAWSIVLSFVQQFAVGIAAGCGLGWCRTDFQHRILCHPCVAVAAGHDAAPGGASVAPE